MDGWMDGWMVRWLCRVVDICVCGCVYGCVWVDGWMYACICVGIPHVTSLSRHAPIPSHPVPSPTHPHPHPTHTGGLAHRRVDGAQMPGRLRHLHRHLPEGASRLPLSFLHILCLRACLSVCPHTSHMVVGCWRLTCLHRHIPEGASHRGCLHAWLLFAGCWHVCVRACKRNQPPSSLDHHQNHQAHPPLTPPPPTNKQAHPSKPHPPFNNTGHLARRRALRPRRPHHPHALARPLLRAHHAPPRRQSHHHPRSVLLGGGGFGSFGLQLYASVCVCIYTNRHTHKQTNKQTFTPSSLPLPLSLYAGLGSPGVYFTLKFTTPPP